MLDEAIWQVIRVVLVANVIAVVALPFIVIFDAIVKNNVGLALLGVLLGLVVAALAYKVHNSVIGE